MIGLDGLEPTIVDQMLERGELPNLSKLRSLGGYSRVRTTTPAQTPVAWSTFATGTNPGGHGIFDFIRRDPQTYLPDLALNRYVQKNPFLPPKAVNHRRGATVWDLLTAAGIPSVILRCPCTYPPDGLDGRMLSGMGVPDVRGGLGTGTFYSTGEVEAGESEAVIRLEPGVNGTFRTHVVGPRRGGSAGGHEDMRSEIAIEVNAAERRAVIHSDGRPGALEVPVGKWSDWLHIKFKAGILQSARGMVRFHLVRTDPALELYASPVNFDPEAPMFPISSPWEYAADLSRRVGTFHTTGMVEDHAGLSNGRFGESAFLDQCDTVWHEREAMMLHELARFDRGLFYCLFDTPDRIQHMFWRFRETDHPANRQSDSRSTTDSSSAVATDFSRVVEDCYRRCDDIVGKVLAHADDSTLLVVLSDHGFNSFQRGVHLNSWLRDHGFLKMSGSAASGEGSDFLRGVDWSATRAYALGLGSIYLNLRGREREGVVAPEDAPGVMDAISSGLSGLVDADRGTRAIRSVVSREQVYSGPYAVESPDLMVNFERGYRVSWATALGGAPPGLIEDNVRRWSGDHIVDPSLVPGVLFMNRPFSGTEARLVDLAPTILYALGVPPGAAMEGVSLLQ